MRTAFKGAQLVLSGQLLICGALLGELGQSYGICKYMGEWRINIVYDQYVRVLPASVWKEEAVLEEVWGSWKVGIK